jgi:hypothetical protein
MERAITVEIQVQFQGSLCEIRGGQSGTGAGFSRLLLVYPAHYNSTTGPFSHLLSGTGKFGPLLA